MKITQKPLPHRKKPTTFEKRTQWHFRGQRNELLPGNEDITRWEEWARGICEHFLTSRKVM